LFFNFSATFNECGDNTWRYRVISTYDELNTLNNYIPSFTSSSTSLVVSGSLQQTSYTFGNAQDSFIFRYKQVSRSSATATIIASISVGGQDGNGGGILVRQDLKSLKNEGAKLSFCGGAKGSDIRSFHISRATNGGNSQKNANTPPEGQAKWLKVEITSSNVNCYFSTSNTATSFTLISTASVSFSGTFYAGFTNFKASTVTFSKIEFTGFSGFCNNNGDCKYDPSNGNFIFTNHKEMFWINVFVQLDGLGHIVKQHLFLALELTKIHQLFVEVMEFVHPLMFAHVMFQQIGEEMIVQHQNAIIF
jgi:hypothetical protein